MSGFEIFGTVGSAISVLEAILWTKSFVNDFIHTKKQKEALGTQLNKFQDLTKELRKAILGQPPASQSTVLSLLDDVEATLNQIKEKMDGSGRIMWKFVKGEIKDMWVVLEKMKTFLMLGMVGQISEGLGEHYEKSSSRYEAIAEGRWFHLAESLLLMLVIRTKKIV
ncbi:hypothetical protein DL96DRAFT_714543 [Flagelloscypha sp. PMI_526]|nr:hypothetical protein DL96DRAFT_714543 [Flagelloscypha sp. PMI_526]